MEDAADDVVILSLRCADFELSKALLEYELEHRLEDITERDRPRIESVLKASTSKIPQVPVELYLSLKGFQQATNRPHQKMNLRGWGAVQLALAFAVVLVGTMVESLLLPTFR
uniref:Uncharacterized protein n=1 Tax=Anopheles merus TaxID=30066 RepID=A0A182UW95_ANOME